MDLGLPLQGGFLQRVPPNATKEQQAVILNDVIDRLNTLLKTQVFSDGVTKRMLFGFQKDGWGAGKDFGIKISMDGIDVTQASDSQLIFKMDMNTWFFYEPSTGRNYMQFGILPDGTGGQVITPAGVSVGDVF